jgi:hypothetical protein
LVLGEESMSKSQDKKKKDKKKPAKTMKEKKQAKRDKKDKKESPRTSQSIIASPLSCADPNHLNSTYLMDPISSIM